MSDGLSKYNPFAKKKSPQELAKEAKRETKRNVRGAQRDMEREMRELDRTEKQVMAEIKKRAQQSGVAGSDPALKSLAKQLVQIRKQREKCISAKAHMGAVGMQATAMSAQVAMAGAVGSVTDAMKTANQVTDAKEMQKIMNEFQRENEKANIKEEMMDDALADAFDTDEMEAQADEITSQVLAELGVELDGKMVGLAAPSAKPAGEEALTEEEQNALGDALPDLKARLDAL